MNGLVAKLDGCALSVAVTQKSFSRWVGRGRHAIKITFIQPIQLTKSFNGATSLPASTYSSLISIIIILHHY